MAKKQQRMPRVLLTPKGRYVLAVFLVNTKENGAPRLCTRMPENHEISLAGGEEFFTAYVPEHVFKKK